MNKISATTKVFFTQKALRFAVTGGLVTLLHIAITVSLVELVSCSPSIANGIAFTLSTLASYTANTLWSFSARLHGRTLFRFVLVSLVGLLMSVAIAWIAQIFGYKYWAGLFGIVIIIPIVTFVLHNLWTYR